MAMTKKEQVAMESLRFELVRAKAFRFTDKVLPDVHPPSLMSDGLTTGWVSWCSGTSIRAEVACSSSVSHAHGRTDRTQSQGSRFLYSSKELALRAARYEAEQQFSYSLAVADIAIAKAKAEGI